jgi:hypothetical protein
MYFAAKPRFLKHFAHAQKAELHKDALNGIIEIDGIIEIISLYVEKCLKIKKGVIY